MTSGPCVNHFHHPHARARPLPSVTRVSVAAERLENVSRFHVFRHSLYTLALPELQGAGLNEK